MRGLLQPLGGIAVLMGLCLFGGAISGGNPGTAAIPGFLTRHVEAEQSLEQRLMGIPDPARAERDLRQLTSEPHMAGTEASHRVAEWLRDQYRSFGFDTEIVTYSVWLALPRQVKLELTAPEHVPLASPEEPFEQDPDSRDKRATVGFNAYSPSGDVTAPVVYVNYGMQNDYRELDSLGIRVEGKIVIARYGVGFRGIKTKLAEEHKAVGVIIYSDPQDDGYTVGDTFPNGPWRPMSGIQRGSVLYTEIYPGDPLTPGTGATPAAKRLAPAEAASLPRIPTMPVNAKDAAVILRNLGGQHVPRGWQGGLPFTYHVGPGQARAHMKLVMDYQQRPIYDVIAKLHGASDDQWVVLGNHHDAWVFGAADPGSGTAAMLETARGLGDLARSGWKPRRTIVMCEWDAEEPGLIGSTEWVEANRAELQSKAVAYINTDVGVTGPNFNAAATPSLAKLVRDATRQVPDPDTGGSVYDAWLGQAAHSEQEASGTARQTPQAENSGEAPLGALGAGSDFSPFFDYAGIPSMDISFGGDYGVYHSIYDDFYWMKHFGDPSFAYHVTLARILGVLALRLDEADILPFDYSAYASEISRAQDVLVSRAARRGEGGASLKAVTDASAELSASASRAMRLLRAAGSGSLDAATENRINRDLVQVEESLLAPEGLAGRPWFKHTIFAPGSYAGYAAEVMPGVSESLDRNDLAELATEADSLAAALRRAASRLDDIARLAQQVVPSSSRAPSSQSQP
ncbi:MAG: M28 family metallopeptidase [Candidatus Acidiferrales bacterium]